MSTPSRSQADDSRAPGAGGPGVASRGELIVETDERGVGFWFVPVMREMVRQGVRSITRPRSTIDVAVGRMLSKTGLMVNLSYGRRAVVAMTGNRGNGRWYPRGVLGEVVPVIFDCWEPNWAWWASALKRGRVRAAMLTARQSAEEMSRRVPGLKAMWVPEAIDPSGYRRGGGLAERDIDVLEIGRPFQRFNAGVREPLRASGVRHVFSLDGPVFPTREGLIDGLSRARAVVCYPRSITHPELAGRVETLTLRYFEAMVSGALVVGHAPAELVDLFGYNPVIELDPSGGAGAARELTEVVRSPERYQELVDRNAARVAEVGTWEVRVRKMLGDLAALGYAVGGSAAR